MHEKSAKKSFFGYQIVGKKTFHIHELNINEIRSQSHHNAEIFLNLSRTDMDQYADRFLGDKTSTVEP